jgi:hypothetical protein
MRMIFLRYLDQESHALWTNLEARLSQEGKKKVRLGYVAKTSRSSFLQQYYFF